MKKKTSLAKKAPTRVGEQFDLNHVTTAGTIAKLWGRNRDVFLRLRVSLRGDAQETDDAYSCYVTVRIPNGTIDGKLITLLPGAAVSVEGYLTHANYDETLRRFLNVAGAEDFLEAHVPTEDLDAWRAIQVKRQNAILNATCVEPLGTGGVKIVNLVDIEGVVVRTWEYPRGDAVDRFVRVAVYDEHTPIREDKKGNFGRPFRQPHYINVLLAGGKTADDIDVVVRPRQRIRVRGELRDQGRRVTLRDALLSLGSTDVVELMGRVVNPDTMNDISAQQESLHILASAAVVYN